MLPLPRTADERIASNDPRPSITERYGSREEYLKRIKAATVPLISQRFMRSEDVDHFLKLSGQLWDKIMATPVSASNR